MYQELTIQLLEQCNLECPYCFAPKSDTGILSEEHFLEFADFCQRNQPDCIHVTGGEPAMHPQFGEIVNRLVAIAPLVIYSNFTIPGVLQKLHTEKNDDIFMLVNLNNREFYTEHQWTILNHNIECALNSGIKIALGHTFFHADQDALESEFTYVFDMLERYNLTHLRLSQATMTSDPDIKEHTNALYKYVADRISDWSEKGFTVYFDCPVPPCFTSPETFKKLHMMGAVSVHCIPKAFVRWNLCVTHCYSTIGLGEDHVLSEFASLQEIENMSESLLTKKFHKDDEKCEDCEFWCPHHFCGCLFYNQAGEQECLK